MAGVGLRPGELPPAPETPMELYAYLAEHLLGWNHVVRPSAAGANYWRSNTGPPDFRTDRFERFEYEAEIDGNFMIEVIEKMADRGYWVVCNVDRSGPPPCDARFGEVGGQGFIGAAGDQSLPVAVARAAKATLEAMAAAVKDVT